MARSPNRWIALLCRTLALGLLAGCGRSSDVPLSGVLITLDTTNATALSCYSGRRDMTPALDRLAAEGVQYRNARTVAPITLPSHASMMTGLYPLRHTVRDNGLRPLPDSADTLAERAAAEGLDTAAFISAVVLSSHFGLDQGFVRYDEPELTPGVADIHILERNADAVTDAAIRWLNQRDPEQPFFLWVHYFDPHAPYAPAEKHLKKVESRKNIRFPKYLAEVVQTDAAIGRLVASLEEKVGLDHLLLAVAADHGESLGRHGEPTHSIFAYDATIRVPMILRHPDGHRKGEKSDAFVSVVDLFPTFVEALGLGEPGDVDGISLYRQAAPDDRGVAFESYSGFLGYGWSPLFGWADRRGTYIHSSRPELFEPTDRDQESAVEAAGPGRLGPFRKQIDELAARPGLPPSEESLDEDLLARIQELGYLGSPDPGTAVPHPLEKLDLPTPRDRLEELRALLLAGDLAARGELDQAVAKLTGLLDSSPDAPAVLETLAVLLKNAGRFEEIVTLLEPRRDTIRSRKDSMAILAFSLEQLDRNQDSLDTYLEGHRSWSDDPQLIHGVIRNLVALGLTEEAAVFRRKLR